MQSSSLFVLRKPDSSLDLTKFIEVPTYKVSRKKGYDSWQDSNWTTHQEIVYRKLTGSFTLRFFEVKDLESFLDFVFSAEEQDGSVLCNVYDNNSRTLMRDKYMFIDFDIPNDVPFYNLKEHDGYEITVTER